MWAKVPLQIQPVDPCAANSFQKRNRFEVLETAKRPVRSNEPGGVSLMTQGDMNVQAAVSYEEKV